MIRRSLKSALICILFVYALSVQGQVKRVLFLGNSYTYVNSLPQITKDFAISLGDSMEFDNNTPGGYTLQSHSTNSTSINKIAQGNWDVVVLQEQSQRPSFPIAQVVTDVFPYARFLDSLIGINNDCVRTMFYMTWGRKNGDASNCTFWPPVCTYMGMDSLLRLRYMMMADSNNAVLSPVGAVWRYLRQNYPAINLYQADESHPSAAGSYAAACCFYTAIFKKDPSLSSFNYSIPSGDALVIRNAAKLIVFDSLLKWKLTPNSNVQAAFSWVNSSTIVSFTNNSQNSKGYLWDFGDGSPTVTTADPVHTYPAPGSYHVTLRSYNGCDTSYYSQNISFLIDGIVQRDLQDEFVIIPNPAGDHIILNFNSDLPMPVRVFNVRGKIMLDLLYTSGNSIDVSSLTSGLYYVMAIEGERIVSARFFKK